MNCGRTSPAGSGHAVRLDPFDLPVQFETADAGADERSRTVELSRERVVVRRAVAGMRMAINLPVSAFRGVAIRLVQDEVGESVAIAVVLEHGDPALSLALFASADGEETVAEWQSWGRVLGLPLLIAERDGTLREPFARIGAVRVGAPAPRRRRRSAIKRRRPSILMRRKTARVPLAVRIYRGEREIIARN
jgi:hypothetical protein